MSSEDAGRQEDWAERPLDRPALVRLAIFVLIVGFMFVGPFYEQVLGHRTNLFRSWTMFSAPGLGIIDPTFTWHRPDGSEMVLDRFDLLSTPRRGKLRVINSQTELASVTRALCKAIGEGADIRVESRVATRRGWQQMDSGEKNACEAAAAGQVHK